MHKYAHVGYPKAASTWLQVFLFPRHPDLCHLGRHTGDEIPDVDLRIALWNDLITRPPLLYQPDEVAGTFNRLFARAAETGATACGISQEVLTLSMIGSVDITERARRLRAAMGEDTRIIIVIRNQLDWIRSVFCGLLREGGMPLGLDEFLFYFYYQQDQSPFCTLFYDDMYGLYVDLFGAENVHIVPFELIKQDARRFAAEICGAIGVRPLAEVPNQSINERPSPKALTACLEYNRNNTFYFGANHFRRPMGFAAEPIFTKRLGVDPPRWMVEERQKSMFAFEKMESVVQQTEKQGRTISPMDTAFPAQYETLLVNAYAPHNLGLTKLTRLDLGTLGYPLP
ncbi:MAG: hypothetical protein HY599_03740 [Candidatus Omnitrophica bacterium]|nr:hypothetical protein [Candidatus Omnitrophota bacterium]